VSSAGISGLNLNNLNIIDSATTGLKIIGPNTFSVAIMSNVVISTYNKSGGGGRGLWATSNASGSMTTNNCLISDTYDQPGNSFTFTSGTASQYYLTMNPDTGGTVSPASGWYNIGTNLTISATASNGYSFSSWTGSGDGSYSGTNNPAATISAPLTQTASFDPIPTRVISLSGNLALGSVPVGSSTSGTFTISNTGNSILTVSNIVYPNGFSGVWSGTIPNGGATNLTVQFSPLIKTNYGGNLSINSDATGGVNTLTVSGTVA
jgi:hypothetical protein